MKNQQIVPFLWFNDNAHEAIHFYTSLFEDTEIGQLGPMVSTFELEGQSFMAINGGPMFSFTPAVSLFMYVRSASDIDKYYEALVDGGKVLMPLGAYPFSEKYTWIVDKFGLSWQFFFDKNHPLDRPTLCPCLLFVGPQFGNAQAAIDFYLKNFTPSGIQLLAKGIDPVKGQAEIVQFASVRLQDTEIVVMESNLDHEYGFTEAFSLYISCQTQTEVDTLWEGLSVEGQKSRCGWLKDKFGVSWQVVPVLLDKLIQDPDPERVKNVMQAMLGMSKIESAELLNAYNT
jgi:predicted 3-demethylubiquinone-9 3-methyltransferase (glyoxalase superfamily)